ncbi:Thymocyte nuclear protein 1 [Psilocybe cubensis]|uniref:Thymocyte nuclear protein 1 n=2 Tax=Psilocybe cubensis TaxID=181762 RepID=A0ACB8H387_PSICU|nr:Thymocyte nuclear protein 1 [Psilocybe cubensis]KAH9482190.1 Thymocyte nuclear protein 1 [Psilocybe cubensis]
MSPTSPSASARYWLLKAEPDTRIVKGKDVKFSVDDFERVKTSPWEGVRNYEARNLMREMKEGDKALFYHSNCKVPGIAAFAQVSKEAYPDYTAWDSSHPYFDPVSQSRSSSLIQKSELTFPSSISQKSDSEDPKWFMVDLTFTSRAPHFVPLALLRKIADLAPSQGIPEEVGYLGEAGVASIKNMDLVTRGRLSVQRVEEGAWKAINELASRGGWEEMDLRPGKKLEKAKDGEPKAKSSLKEKAKPKPRKKASETKEDNSMSNDTKTRVDGDKEKPLGKATDEKRKVPAKRKREAKAEPDSEVANERDGLRRSTRARK